jgi:hypothetical protein
MYISSTFGKPRFLSVLDEKYFEFTQNTEWEAEDAVKGFKNKIIRRLSDRDNFMSWRKTHKMLMRLKIARKEFRKLEWRVAEETHSRRKYAKKLAM